MFHTLNVPLCPSMKNLEHLIHQHNCDLVRLLPTILLIRHEVASEIDFSSFFHNEIHNTR